MSHKRFDCTNGKTQFCYGCYQMTEVEDGEYVLASDYDKVIVQLAETELRAIKWYHQIRAHVELYQELKAEHDKLAQENAELKVELSALGKPK